MKYLFLLISISVLGQSYTVKDKITNQNLSYSNIHFGDSGTYSDENGKFSLPNNLSLNDTIEISHVGYVKKSILFKNLADFILLTSKEENLEEVIIYDSDIETVNIPKSKSKDSHILVRNYELLTLLKPEKFKDKTIVSVTFYFDNSKGIKKHSNDGSSGVRFHFYSLKNGEIDEEIFTSEVLKIKLNNEEQLKLDLLSHNLKFLSGGVAIGLEYIGTITESGSISQQNNFLRPKFSKKPNKNYTAKSFQFFSFDKAKELSPVRIPTDLSNTEFNDDYYLSFDLELIK
ncbi:MULTISPECIES: carboxypeptidase-like regulatory domain-containing protein [Mesonia]|uniref:carboxypeptidase-like regulatory domain-containing protein n=2 Tax=Flavobacteriaceae TaxID=49546 RepID=UPI0026EE2B05|nr:carboxypeptidase-like regulatory domain-containing protein [Mesonia mobilis]|tara:strand:- start:1116 stop:1979 length:864 start_codon:yes stop_codon:yes gene_type:complete